MIDVLKIIKLPGSREEQLCRPISQQETPEIFFEKKFPLQEITVSLRPLCIKTDLDTVYEWVNQEFAKSSWQKNDGPLRQLKQAYEMILCSDFAQSFVALVGEEPVCQLDIFHALQHDISLLYDAQESDYCVNVLLSPAYKSNAELSACVLQTFLDYFFHCDGIKRIIADPEADDTVANDLLVNLGFQFQARTCMSFKIANLYICTKKEFCA